MGNDKGAGRVTLRHESKHRINLREDSVLSRRLDKLFPRDAHAGADGTYLVTSLYFDTPDDRALRQKLDGVDRREKFRLRYYGETPELIRLEKKYKIGGLCGKRSVVVSRELTRQILSGSYGGLLKLDDPLGVEFYAKAVGTLLRPKTVVRYRRAAYIYGPGSVRITLDRDLRTGFRRVDFLDPHIPLMSVCPDFTVLEVKYGAFLPDVVRMAVQVPGRQAAACSKYALCRRFD